MLYAEFLNVLVKCRFRLFRLAKLSSSCLQRERYFSRCGVSRERKGKNVFRHPPLEAAVPQNEVYHRRDWLAPRSKKMQTPRRGRLLPGTFCQILVDGRPGSWLSARRPLLALPRSLHGKLLQANWRSDFTTSYAFSGLDTHTIASPCTDSNLNEQTIEAS